MPRTSTDDRSSANTLWNDDELEAAVVTYLYALRLQASGHSMSETEIARHLILGPLPNRNKASIRYRMRNISSVLRRRGISTLDLYSPAASVGSGVTRRLDEIIDQLAGSPLDPAGSSMVPSRRTDVGAVRELLDRLASALEELSPECAGIGHNNPPEPIEDRPPLDQSSTEVRELTADIRALRDEIEAGRLNETTTSKTRDSLTKFGLKLARWIGVRATKFTDAALLTLAPIAVAKATNVLSMIPDVIAALTRLLGH
jgi:hypothetical protein